MSSSIAPEVEPAETERPTADIIPFPVRAQAPRSQAPEEPWAGDRLTKALASLNAALAEQREALATWRQALGDLKTTTTGLGESLQRYHSSLGTLNGSVLALQTKAQSLEQWADGVLAD